MVKYDTEWVKEQCSNAFALDHHKCSICGVTVNYEFHDDGFVFFNGNCDCVTYYSPPRPSSFEEISIWLRAQDSDEVRDRIMSGLRLRRLK